MEFLAGTAQSVPLSHLKRLDVYNAEWEIGASCLSPILDPFGNVLQPVPVRVGRDHVADAKDKTRVSAVTLQRAVDKPQAILERRAVPAKQNCRNASHHRDAPGECLEELLEVQAGHGVRADRICHIKSLLSR